MRARIIAEARTYLGVPWRHQGRTRLGVDCVGLIVCVGKELQLLSYDHMGYKRLPRASGSPMLEQIVKAGGRKKPVQAARPGDTFIFRERAYPMHMGILSGDETMIHAYARRKMVVEEPLDDFWRERLLSCYAFPGILD